MESDKATRAETERGTGLATVAQALAACQEEDGTCPAVSHLSHEDRAELQSLLRISHRLDARMAPFHPSPAFRESLGDELMREAKHRMLKREKRHRIAVISAAIAGGIVSIASLVGGIVVLVKWLRTRSESRQASTA